MSLQVNSYLFLSGQVLSQLLKLLLCAYQFKWDLIKRLWLDRLIINHQKRCLNGVCQLSNLFCIRVRKTYQVLLSLVISELHQLYLLLLGIEYDLRQLTSPERLGLESRNKGLIRVIDVPATLRLRGTVLLRLDLDRLLLRL